MEKNKMHVVINIDKGYVNQATVTLTSICENLNSNFQAVFHVFCHDFIEKPLLFKKLEEKYGCVVNCIDAKQYSYYFKDFSFKNSMNFWITPATFDRLLMFKYLPDDVEKAIYVDCDIAVDGDLSKVYTKMEDDKLIAAVVDIYFCKNIKRFYKNYCDFEEFSNWIKEPLVYAYFCSGFYVANIKKIKEMGIFEELMNVIKIHNNFKLMDQDALNAIFSQKYHDYMKYLPLEYNVFADINPRHYKKDNKFFYSKSEIVNAYKKPIIIHYAGFAKPWKNYLVFGFADKWWKYYHLSPVKLEKIPHFKWRIFHLLRKLIY